MNISDTPEEKSSLIRSERVFSGKVWHVHSEEFEYFNNKIVREVIKHPGAVAIIAVNNKNEVLLVKQYRHPVKQNLWELPAGLLDIEGEDKLVAAKRELLEETSYQAEKWQLLSDIYLSPGGSDENAYIYLAEDLNLVKNDYQKSDEEAHMIVDWVAFEDVLDAVLAGKVKNALLCYSILRLAVDREYFIKE